MLCLVILTNCADCFYPSVKIIVPSNHRAINFAKYYLFMYLFIRSYYGYVLYKGPVLKRGGMNKTRETPSQHIFISLCVGIAAQLSVSIV